MKKRVKLESVLYLLSGICFFIAALVGKNYVFIPIGCCFVILGVTNAKNKPNNESNT